MERKQFIDNSSLTFEACLKLLEGKGQEYSVDECVFSAFKTMAKDIGVDPIVPMKCFMNKHWYSLNTIIKDVAKGTPVKEIDAKSSEPIGSRIEDMINYLLFVDSYIKEKRSNNE